MTGLVHPGQAMAELKDFQRATARHVYERLYDGRDPQHRFLVADEVGLGKTLVARGVIAQAVDHLDRAGTPRIDVLYVCSNAAIARQNLRKLDVTGGDAFTALERITLLPLGEDHLDARRVNLIPITPGTSLHFGRRTGRWKERALLLLLLESVRGGHGSGLVRAFARGLSTGDPRDRYRAFRRAYRRSVDREAVHRFARALSEADRERRARGVPTFEDELAELAHGFRNPRPGGYPRQLDLLRKQVMGQLRALLAEVCVESLQPDIVILDEFQRFKSLLQPAPDDHGAQLAHRLFRFEDPHTRQRARVLLLSATPYKMFTVTDEPGAEDHYRDLLDTVAFLLDDEAATARLERDLRQLREGLLDLPNDGGRGAGRAARAVEATLRRVMVRTERLASTPDRDGMLATVRVGGLQPTTDDVAAYLDHARIAGLLGQRDIVEYWKSSPYLLNFMEHYQLKQALEERTGRRDRALADLLARTRGLLPWADVDRYREVDAGNPRLRRLLGELEHADAWRLLWLPASRPYYATGTEHDGAAARAFTKRLVFSAWSVVPKAVAALTSYEAERRQAADGRRTRRRYTTESTTRLLEFRMEGARAASMTTLAVLYPSPALAELADPRRVAADLGSQLPALDSIRRRARSAAEGALRPIVGDRYRAGGAVDPRWYWAAPLYLDRRRNPDAAIAWFDLADPVGRWAGEEVVQEPRRFRAHLAEARAWLAGHDDLGRAPTDLADVVTELALGGPAVCALRALTRVTDLDVGSPAARDAAARVAWGARTLFNQPEATDLLRARVAPDLPYWRAVLRYAMDGNLQAVLDEHAHVLREWRGHVDSPDERVAADVAEAMAQAMSLRAASYGVDIPSLVDGRVDLKPASMRARFAVPFGAARSSEEAAIIRVEQVRDAFNSPFWPFVLVSTSIGQEGLDFHLYAHAVVHWNLPANPVDLEQREGRVHRYKGHAVRKNVARSCAAAALDLTWRDPWEAMFAQAAALRPPGRTEVEPYWVFNPGGDGARIERHLPILPLSREARRCEALLRSLATYRLAFGTPRQEELLAYLHGRVPNEELDRLARDLAIDLSPPPEPSP